MLSYYVVFCTVVAMVALTQVFKPCMDTLTEIRPWDNLVEYKCIAYATFFIVSFIAAPILVFLIITPSSLKKFKEVMDNTLLDGSYQ